MAIVSCTTPPDVRICASTVLDNRYGHTFSIPNRNHHSLPNMPHEKVIRTIMDTVNASRWAVQPKVFINFSDHAANHVCCVRFSTQIIKPSSYTLMCPMRIFPSKPSMLKGLVATIEIHILHTHLTVSNLACRSMMPFGSIKLIRCWPSPDNTWTRWDVYVTVSIFRVFELASSSDEKQNWKKCYAYFQKSVLTPYPFHMYSHQEWNQSYKTNTGTTSASMSERSASIKEICTYMIAHWRTPSVRYISIYVCTYTGIYICW